VRIDSLRFDPQKIGNLLDDDVMDEGGELETVASAQLDRPPVHDQSHRAPTILDPSQRNRVEVERVDRLTWWHLFDGELDLGQLVPPASLEVLDGVEHQVVEALGATAVTGDRGQGERATWATATTVTAAARSPGAVRPGAPVQWSQHAGERRRPGLA
jgi:hypothetical protein